MFSPEELLKAKAATRGGGADAMDENTSAIVSQTVDKDGNIHVVVKPSVKAFTTKEQIVGLDGKKIWQRKAVDGATKMMLAQAQVGNQVVRWGGHAIGDCIIAVQISTKLPR